MKNNWIIIVVFFCGWMYSQSHLPIDLTSFNIEQGLSNYRVYDIYEAKDGFVWLGTDNGLNRFDGTNFKVYQNNPTDTTTISKGKILKIDQDKDGIIWFVTDGGGLNSFNPLTEKNTRFFDKDEHRQLHWSYMKDLIIQDDLIWIASWGGLIQFNRLNYQTRVFTWNSTLGKMRNEDVKSMSLDKRGLLWLGTTYGISVLNTKTMNFVDVDVVEEYNANHHLDVRTLFLDSSNRLWVGKIGFLLCLDPITSKITYYNLDKKEPTSNIINSIVEDEDNRLWVGTENGVFIADQKTQDGVKSFYKTQLPSVMVHGIHIDRNKRAWIGTGNEGFLINNFRPKKIGLVTVDKEGSTGKEIRSIIKLSDEEILFSTYRQAIVKYNTRTQEANSILKDTYLSNCKITALLLDGNKLWFGTVYNGLFVYDLKTKKFTQIAQNEAVVSMALTKDRVVVGTGNGVRLYDKRTYETEELPSNNEILAKYKYDYIEFVHVDQLTGEIWLSSTNHGLSVLDTNFNLKVTLNYKDEELIEPFSFISYYKKDRETYLGTNSGIIKKYNGKTLSLFFDAGKNIEITGILQDNEGRFWIGSTNGIYLLHENSTTSYTYFGKNEGFNSYQFFHQSTYKDADGILYFGGSNGLNFFDPKDVAYPKERLKTIISDVLVFNKNAVFDSIVSYKNNLVFRHDQNFITLHYNNLGFEKKGSVFYKYRLKGLSDQWVTVHDQNAVTYTNLSPGNYEFEVVSANDYGDWNTTPATIGIIVTPPFWQTWWFYSLIFFLVSGGLYWIIKDRVSKLVTEKELAIFKLQALRSQMNPHFIFNALNSIQHFIIKNESRFALDYLTKFSNLVRKILDNSMNNKITLSDEIAFLKEYVEIESLRFSKPIEFKINTAKNLELDLIEIPSMLIQPYVENAIIHGLMNKTDNENCKLEIDFKVRGKYLKCEIVDNGVGREAAMDVKKKLDSKRKSHGLSITKKRLETLNRYKKNLAVQILDLKNAQGEVGGTMVALSILIDTQ